jgi:hypothetical protein
MINRVWLMFAFLSVPIAGFGGETDSPEPVLRQFLKALYTGDKVTFSNTTLAYGGTDEFLSSIKVPENRKKDLERDLANVQFERSQPFTLNGLPVKREPTNGYPNGTKVIYVTGSRHGGRLVADSGFGTISLTCVKHANQWKLDMRWAVESAKKKIFKTTDPEIIAEKAIFYQIANDKTNLAKVVTPDFDVKSLLKHPSLPDGDMDQIFALCQEMVFVLPFSEETFELPSGKIMKQSEKTPDNLILLGMMGPCEIAVELKKIHGEWKVIPQDYFGFLHKQNAL